MAKQETLLIKLAPTSELALRTAERRANLRPLDLGPRKSGLALADSGGWFQAELDPDMASPWDLAHRRLADRLGLAGSDILFAEPDWVNSPFPGVETPASSLSALGEDCTPAEQSSKGGKKVGPDGVFGWHLGDEFSQLRRARQAVEFSDDPRRTRIAILDTGYSEHRSTEGMKIAHELERDYVDDDRTAIDPNQKRLFDQTGHGTATQAILAGGEGPGGGVTLGGAPEASVVPVRVARSVVLLRTSALAKALSHAANVGCDVLSLSMGGWPSRLWAETVDDVYLRGLVICAAAGNHVGVLPPRRMIYPARYPRVIGVCGVMANHRPYDDLTGLTLEGSFGPKSAMRTAMAAYTPNIPWARIGCESTYDLDGAGTSAATPQVAAAAALWLEKHKAVLPRTWRRVEAVRHALFSSAQDLGDPEHFGNGVLKAFDALAVRPNLACEKSPRSRNSFAFLRLITGIGFDGPTPREAMFNLEIAQRWLLEPELQEVVPDPEAEGPETAKARRRFLEILIDSEETSGALRRHLESRAGLVGVGQGSPTAAIDLPRQPAVPTPNHRKLKVYAVDPSLAAEHATATHHQVTLSVPWEPLKPGPEGEYLRVEGGDPSGDPVSGVDLDDPRLLAQDGWAPSESNLQFHQQMVYGVASKTIACFETALGRPVFWRPRIRDDKPEYDGDYVQHLRIRPHALHQANAYYSPRQVALLFGYFESSHEGARHSLPGSRVYTCLSHDVIAHETTHAILDGLFPRFNEASNPDVLAFHEALADAVALFQRFTLTEVLEREIARTRGDLESDSILGQIALQLGDAVRGRGALRDAIGRLEEGVWTRAEPDPAEMERRRAPHARGALLVAALFDAFLTIYRTRTEDLVRLATGGTGRLPEGEIPPDLVRRLSREAAKTAGHLLNICIRSLDYMPPMDPTFFEFLRAMITADFELVKDDRYGYRVALIEAFRRRGVRPPEADEGSGVLHGPSVDTLLWRGLDDSRLAAVDGTKVEKLLQPAVRRLKRYAELYLYKGDREVLFKKTRWYRYKLHQDLCQAFEVEPSLMGCFYLDPERPSFEVHELRRALRLGPDGMLRPQVIVALTQSEVMAGDDLPPSMFRGGSTLVFDLMDDEIRYCIHKDFASTTRRERQEAYLRDAASDPFRALCSSPGVDEPFAVLHGVVEGSADG